MKRKKTASTPKKDSPDYIVTDDSGVVISLRQYSELHGDGNSGHGFSRSWGIGSNKIPQDKSSSFAEIAREKGFVPQSEKILCVECGKFFAISKFNSHIIYEHPFLVDNLKSDNVTDKSDGVNNERLATANKRNSEQRKKCELCEVITLGDNFEYHLIDAHFSVYREKMGWKKNELVLCKICETKMRPTHIKRHLLRVHKVTIEVQRNEGLANLTNKKAVSANVKKINFNESAESALPEDQVGNIAEAFRQAFDEKRDGSKGLGHLRREWDGKYGSYPIHDDHSDESDDT